MQMQKKSNDELLYIRDLLSKKREELIDPFLSRDPELMGNTFKYERNQSAFNLVREQYITLWIDNHFVQLMKDNVPHETLHKCLSLLSGLLQNTNRVIDDSEISHCILSAKNQVIQELLNEDERNTVKLNELRYSYEKDRALFEREFEKYERELKENTH